MTHNNNNNYEDEDEDYLIDEEEINNIKLDDMEPPVQLNTSFANYIIIDNIPNEVVESKHDKLKAVLHRVYSKNFEIAPNGFYMPLTEKKLTKGYCFIEYVKKEGAIDAFNNINNYALDTKHTLRVNLLDDHKKLMNFPAVYTEPKAEEFVIKENNNNWLYNEKSLKGYDEFVLRYGDTTEICWNEMNLGKPTSEIAKTQWTSSYVQWSNSGTYLVTFHPDRIVLFGGENWTQIAEFKHRGVQLIDFSPEDKYLVTFAPVTNDDPKDPKSIIVWDIRSGKKLRGFVAPPKEHFSWPAFHWSAKDRYFARQQADKGIDIYEAPSCNLLDNKTVPIPRVKDFSWSPSDLALAYFVPCTDGLPAKITVLEVPSKKVLAEKPIWEALDARFHWQNAGDYLCVKVDKKLKKNQPTAPATNFELFRMHESNVPIENFEVSAQVKAFAWEPRGKRIAVIHGEHRHDMTVSFFEITKKKVNFLTKLEHRKLNTIFWSPHGNYVLLATVGDTGELEFFNVNDLETMSTQEHLQCTGVDWNPSGRFVTTYVSHWKVTTDAGYKIWTFAGEPVYAMLKDRFYQFVWRPRPQLILTDAQIGNIKSSLKTFADKFKEMDERDHRAKVEEENRRLDQLMKEFLGLVQRNEKEYQSHAAERAKRNICEDIDQKDLYEDYEPIKELVDVQSIVIKK
ncbi:RNA-binding region RNP-1 domain-containing protein [Cavenderia fasciculata]|uniref:Eukaryotic translation initiation factor 3 subunit B n=1 Tax=Cavenderia fasciculata TaxID=261658 RepID=F4QBA6_CACFS|nr:RNA-binding region RNP-1 domain-containing protein [Cavenderia fasciculata]EGG14878.1 RNA-binding region RNP-1 domain-containing protein [Cavenderia fasciculata]|eukprot:XP_004351394.1 RNA-binding region RNP-1 domain-containing protein [Cavenderia fasciculata]